VWVTSRDEAKRAYALENGAHAVFESGARLPERVDTVIESVGQATWDHSLKSVRPGGIIVVSGATSGAAAMTDLRRIFFLQVSVVGSTMGTISEFRDLITFLDSTGLRPKVAQAFPLSEAREALALMESGDVFGKLVLVP
jgi:NADPH:quinone reductase-like Zn-dependent oxidoreductase